MHASDLQGQVEATAGQAADAGDPELGPVDPPPGGKGPRGRAVPGGRDGLHRQPDQRLTPRTVS